MSTEEKIRKLRQDIGYQRKLLNLDEDLYREMLYKRFKVESCKDLSESQAKIFLNMLRDEAKKAGVFKPKKQYAFQKYKHNNLERDGYAATPKQLRKIEAMWFEVSAQKTDEDRADTLNKFIKRIAGVEHIKFLLKADVEKVIMALNKMKEKKEVNNDQCTYNRNTKQCPNRS
jgi:hypothetical protein